MNEWHLLMPDKVLLKAQSAQERLRQLHQRDVRALMERSLMGSSRLTCAFAFKEWRDETVRELHRGKLKGRATKSGDIIMKAISKWVVNGPQLWMHAVLGAFWQELADARQARGHCCLVTVRQAWRSGALHAGRLYVAALEARVLVTFLIHWQRTVVKQRFRRFFIEASSENLEMTDKLGVMTGTLQGEMQTHNLTFDALEHEVLLLEATLQGGRH